jgi:hypothetical protein
MAVQIQFRRGTAAQWTSANPTLAEGEMGVETDTGNFKIGNGSLAWDDLSYGGLSSLDPAPLYLEENVQTANYTLALADVAKVVAVNSSSNLTLTVPLNSSVAFPLGTVVNVYRAGTGTVTIAGASGVTVRNAGAISDQFGEVSLRKRGTDEWVLSGDVS